MPRGDNNPCRFSNRRHVEQQRTFDSDSGFDLRDSRRSVCHGRVSNDHVYGAYGVQHIYNDLFKSTGYAIYGYPDLCGAVSGADGSCYGRFVEYDQRDSYGNIGPAEPSGRCGYRYNRRDGDHHLYAVYGLHGHKCSDG